MAIPFDQLFKYQIGTVHYTYITKDFRSTTFNKALCALYLNLKKAEHVMRWLKNGSVMENEKERERGKGWVTE
eukprot:6209824-Pleurochrysis_carterae.AAC.7